MEPQTTPDGQVGSATDIWHKYGRPHAIKEGWDLFTRDDNRLDIERIDTPSDHPELEGQDDWLFDSDVDAVKHIVKRAGEGSKPHLLALYLDGRCHTDKVWVDATLVELIASKTCARCSYPLDAHGFCTDVTCPFSDHQQTCEVGWAGHPDRDPHPDDDLAGNCSCGGRRKFKITVSVPTKIFFDVDPEELADCERENEPPPTDQQIIDYVIGPAFVVQVDTESHPELSGAIFAGTAIHPDGFKIERTPQ